MLNETRIKELKTEVGEDDFIEVVELFCEEVEDILNTLPATARVSLPEKLHFLKGSALNIGLDVVGDLCRAEELRLGSDPDAMPDIEAIRKAYVASKNALLG
jgi:HPt (histidine-containing phosphotransfer) domain-containing protein